MGKRLGREGVGMLYAKMAFLVDLCTCILGQKMSEGNLYIQGNLWDQLFLVSFDVVIIRIYGDRAREDAFSRKWLIWC